MDECSLPKARPILCNESPAFQRHHMSLFCAAESPNRFPWVINTTFGEKTYIRWCCNDRLSSHPSRDTNLLNSYLFKRLQCVIDCICPGEFGVNRDADHLGD